MTLHHHCSVSDIDHIFANDSPDYQSFSRNVTVRASTGTLKQPRLPGSEKFRFSQNLESNRFGPLSNTLPERKNRRGNSCSSALISTGSTSKRKPILPISRITSRVLNNTNVELSADTVEVITQEGNDINKICKNYLDEHSDHTEESNSEDWSRSSSDQSLERQEHFPKHILPPRKSRSMAPVQHLETNNNQPKFASIQSNRLRARSYRFSSSPSHGIVSSDDDIWLPRTNMTH